MVPDLSGRGESVPTIWLQQISNMQTTAFSGRSFSYEEVKASSQHNREKRLSAP